MTQKQDAGARSRRAVDCPMRKHEFYADPTVFDRWQNDAETWLDASLGKIAPFSWAMGFGALAVAFLLIATSVFIDSLQYRPTAIDLVEWNRLLAQQVTLVIALAASIIMFKQANLAWPEHLILPTAPPVALAPAAGSNKSKRNSPPSISSGTEAAVALTDEDREAVQAFFAGVRAAGVNVVIAKALYAGGVRSVDHLRQVEDSELRRIHGVGPATVRKLRTHFAQPQ